MGISFFILLYFIFVTHHAGGILPSKAIIILLVSKIIFFWDKHITIQALYSRSAASQLWVDGRQHSVVLSGDILSVLRLSVDRFDKGTESLSDPGARGGRSVLLSLVESIHFLLSVLTQERG